MLAAFHVHGFRLTDDLHHRAHGVAGQPPAQDGRGQGPGENERSQHSKESCENSLHMLRRRGNLQQVRFVLRTYKAQRVQEAPVASPLPLESEKLRSLGRQHAVQGTVG